jgi:uncharacterized protein
MTNPESSTTIPVVTAARPSTGWTELLVAAAAYLVLGTVGGFALSTVPGALTDVVLVLLATAIATFGAVAIALAPRVRSFAPLRLRSPGTRWLLGGVAAGVGVFLVNQLVIIGWVLLTGDTSNPQQTLSAGAAAGGWSLVGVIALGGLVIPLAEELLFRGIGYTALRRYGVLVAVLASSAVFGLAHGLSIVLVAAFVVGVVNAWMFERSGSVWPGVLAHATNNTTLFVLAAVFA